MRYIGAFPPDLAAGPMWPQIAALLEKSLPYGRGEYSLDDLRAGIKDYSLIALGASDEGVVSFVAVCGLQITPRKRVLYVIHGAGIDGASALDALVTTAKRLECDWVETRTRPAVARLYQRLGFDTGYTVSILEVP